MRVHLAAYEIQKVSPMGWLERFAAFKMHFRTPIALCCELGAHLAAAVSARIGEENLTGGSGMAGQEIRKLGGMIPLV